LSLNHRLIDTVNFLENLTNLVVLKLDSTKLTHFEDETFKSLKSLSVLHIRAENFRFGEGKWLECLTNLRELNLSDVKLDRADLIGIGCHLTKLEKFQFEKFFLGHIKLNNLSREVLSGLRALKSLHFQGIFIENIESNAFECLNGLTELTLTDVHIPLELTSSSFGRLKLLRRLNFTDNSLKTIKDEFFFQNFPNLRHLNLRHSYDLTLTPLVFQKLTNLVSLNLSQINDVLAENVFVNLNRLNRLSLRRCELASLVEGWFNGLGELRELDLGENRLGKFNFEILRQMPKLKRISLCFFQSDETSNAREFLNLGIELVDFDLFNQEIK
jgi:Leucine-rich repeat (LRR) protein